MMPRNLAERKFEVTCFGYMSKNKLAMEDKWPTENNGGVKMERGDAAERKTRFVMSMGLS